MKTGRRGARRAADLSRTWASLREEGDTDTNSVDPFAMGMIRPQAALHSELHYVQLTHLQANHVSDCTKLISSIWRCQVAKASPEMTQLNTVTKDQ